MNPSLTLTVLVCISGSPGVPREVPSCAGVQDTPVLQGIVNTILRRCYSTAFI